MLHRPFLFLRRAATVLASLSILGIPMQSAADVNRLMHKGWAQLMQAAEAQGKVEIHDDFGSAGSDAVVNMQGCTGTLIAPDVVLTAGHCAPKAGQVSQVTPAGCEALPHQARLAKNASSAPTEWLPVKPDAQGWRPQIRIGVDNRNWSFTTRAAAVAVPRCADLALVRLDDPVPGYRARPMPVMVTPPFDVYRTLATHRLRHAGWGKAKSLQHFETKRQTGDVTYWGSSACHIVGLPPLKPGGQRIISGDSGSPLILRQNDEDIVVGVLFGSGLPDASTCGLVRPLPPSLHGTYTPTFRSSVPGSGSTDIGAWLREMVPDAEFR